MPEGAFVNHQRLLCVERRTAGCLESLDELTLRGYDPPRLGGAWRPL
jgi:hypothetical protein